GTMRKVQPSDIHALVDEHADDARVARGGPQGTHDLGSPHWRGPHPTFCLPTKLPFGTKLAFDMDRQIRYVCLLFCAACTEQRAAPDLRGQDVRLTILHTADIHSRLVPYHFAPGKIDQDLGLDTAKCHSAQYCTLPNPATNPGCDCDFGGIARIATIVKRERANAARSMHLDAGDAFEGAPIFNIFQGEAEFRALSALGLDAAALGNHEFDKGATNLELQIRKWAGYPILAANYMFYDPKDPTVPKLGEIIAPYPIFNVHG